MLKIWTFENHYMLKYENNGKSFGWRVNISLSEDFDFLKRIDRLKNFVKNMNKE